MQNMDKKIKFYTKSIVLCSLMSIVSCDSGSDSNDSNANASNVTVAPPSDLSGVVETNTTSPTNSGSVVSLQATYQSEILTAINAQRASIGLPALVEDTRITSLAAEHNQNMADATIASGGSAILISHDGFTARATQIFSFGYNRAGENVAANRGFDSSQVASALVSSWVNSAEHLANINGDFTHTGVAVLVDTRDNTVYATQLFANQP